MAWVELKSNPTEVIVYKVGTIAWNDAVQSILGNPKYVKLYHDAATNRASRVMLMTLIHSL